MKMLGAVWTEESDMKLSIGDKVLYRKNDVLYEGIIKSIRGEKIEIDDKSIKLIVADIAKNTIAAPPQNVRMAIIQDGMKPLP